MNNSQKLKLMLLGSLALCVIVFLAVCFAGLSALEKKSQNMVTLKQQSQDLDAQTQSLNIAKKEVAKYKYFNDIANTIIPNDKDQVEAVAEILQMADQSGILLQNVSFPTSTLGATGVSGSSASSAATTAPAAGAATQKASNLISQAKPVTGIPGLYSIEVVVSPETGDKVPASKLTNYNKMIAFLSKIEHDQRTAQITQVSIQPPKVGDTSNTSFTFTFNINIFIKP
jgi:hypothetical protein